MIIIAGIVIPKLVNEYLTENMITQLQLSLDEIAGNLALNDKGKLSLTEGLSDPRFKKPYSGLYWSANSSNQLLRSRSLWDKKIQEEKGHLSKTLVGAKNEELLYISQSIYLPGVAEPVNVIVGVDRKPLEVTLEKVIAKLWLILSILFIGILLFIIAQVHWSLRPLNNLHRQLNSLKEGKQESINGEFPVELAPVVSDLNALLFHYQELLHRARNHAGNLSHAIKTPLSILRNQVSLLSNTDYKILIQSINQVQRQIDHHMSKTRVAGSIHILSVKTKPCERVDAISMAFDKVYSSRNVLLINELAQELEVLIEQADLDDMLGNLIENAYKWSNSLIRVHAKAHEEHITIFVDDDGPGIANEQLDNITKRGYRLDEEVMGSGLGLNIASEIAHSYRGSLSFKKSSMGGLSAALTLIITT
ncbi:ATP-binding protein [Shewanella psychrophila]|nr:ATP-binding protein [Shewanella psychrophila]